MRAVKRLAEVRGEVGGTRRGNRPALVESDRIEKSVGFQNIRRAGVYRMDR